MSPPEGDASVARTIFSVGIIGPVYPWRGGIAHYTTTLRHALSASCQVRTVSFASLYPRWLYPGKGMWEPEPSQDRQESQDAGVFRILRPFGPPSWQETVRELTAAAVQAVLISWWTVFWAPAFWYMARKFRRHLVPVLWICHNLWDHEDAVWKRWLARLVLAEGDAYLVHAASYASVLQRLFPQRQVLYHPLPWAADFPDPTRTLPRRARLELLFFGLVRPYKGVDVLLEAMRRLQGEDVALSVVGEWWVRDGRLCRIARQMPNVEIVDRYVSKSEAADFFGRADAVVLPYRTASASAVLPLAYRYGKPVIASDVEALADTVQEGATGIRVPPGDAEALAAAIRTFAFRRPFTPEAIAAAAARVTWDALARELLDFLPSVRLDRPVERGGPSNREGR